MDVDKKTRLEPFSFPDGTYNIRLARLFCQSPNVR